VIVTVTLNPSLDQTLEVDTLVRGGINKTEHLRRDPGGKGVNVARALSTNGVPAVAVFPAGGLIGDALVSLLVGQRVDVEVVRIGGMTRANGQRLRDMILSRGGSGDVAALYRAFRGRDPSIEPLLRARGLGSETAAK